METNQIAKLRRMRDQGPSSIEVNQRISDGISSVLASSGFQSLDTPILEQTDLFVRKSGGEIAGNLYSFVDPGGIAVSLRPEFTPSVIRWFIENDQRLSDVHRFRYSGPVFRYGGGRGASFRQFQQCGGELIGVAGPEGDSEILETAIRCLSSAGFDNYSIRLGHVGVVRELVRSQQLSEPLQMFILSNLGEVAGREDGIGHLTDLAISAGLVYESDRLPVTAPLGDDAIPALESLVNSLSGPTGRRTPEQIMARLASRMQQAASEPQFRSALANVSALISSRGAPPEVLGSIADVMKSKEASLRTVEGLADTVDSLTAAVGTEVSIDLDFSFVRGLAYYTGIVFEFSAERDGEAVALGGGGRYDDLVRAFGGQDVAACGFALNVDDLALTRIAAPVEVTA